MNTIINILMLTLFAFSPKAKPPRHDIQQISIRQGPCYGACPIYTATFNKDGSATFEGEKPRFHSPEMNLRIGKFWGKITMEKFDSLAEIIEEVDFFKMSNYRERVTDLSTTYITVTTPETTKTIEIYGIHIPEEMERLRRAIKETVDQTSWQKLEEADETE